MHHFVDAAETDKLQHAHSHAAEGQEPGEDRDPYLPPRMRVSAATAADGCTQARIKPASSSRACLHTVMSCIISTLAVCLAGDACATRLKLSHIHNSMPQVVGLIIIELAKAGDPVQEGAADAGTCCSAMEMPPLRALASTGFTILSSQATTCGLQLAPAWRTREEMTSWFRHLKHSDLRVRKQPAKACSYPTIYGECGTGIKASAQPSVPPCDQPRCSRTCVQPKDKLDTA